MSEQVEFKHPEDLNPPRFEMEFAEKCIIVTDQKTGKTKKMPFISQAQKRRIISVIERRNND